MATFTDLDFTSGFMPAGASIARAAGPSSVTSGAGKVSKSTAANTARFERSLSTGAVFGLLLEPERTNWLSQSDRYVDPPWTSTAASITDGRTSPLGTTSARSSGGQSVAFGQRVIGFNPQDKPFTISGYFAGAGFGLTINGLSNGGNSSVYTDITATADWVRQSSTLPNGVSDSGLFWLARFNNAPLDLSAGQLEQGAQPSTYIEATTGPATRPGETFLYAGPNITAPTYQVELSYLDGTTETRTANAADYVLSLPASATPRIVTRMRILNLGIVAVVTPLSRTATLRDVAPRIASL